METKIITCITCPVGCDITVQGDKNEITSITGYDCKRGEVYARNEFTHPSRILTTLVKVNGGNVPLVPVRSTKPVPMEKIMDCMAIIKNTQINAPVQALSVVVPNIMETGIDIIATGAAE